MVNTHLKIIEILFKNIKVASFDLGQLCWMSVSNTKPHLTNIINVLKYVPSFGKSNTIFDFFFLC